MLKGLSLTQPWAWLMTTIDPRTGLPYKGVENRSWCLWESMRGVEFAVCSTKTMTLAEYEFGRSFAEARGVVVPEPKDLLLGHALGLATAYACSCPEGLPFHKVDLSWKMRGLHAHLWQGVRKLESPVPAKGGQGFFLLPPDVEQLIREQLPRL